LLKRLLLKKPTRKSFNSDNYFIISVWSRAVNLIVEEGAAIPSFTCGAKSFEQALIESMMNEQL
jgi:hypothetical protein